MITKKESNKNLLILADFLDKLPRKRFNYGHWVGEDFKGKKDLSCGTTACALGWATVIPHFNRKGLRAGRDEEHFFMLNKRRVCAAEVISKFFGTDIQGVFYPSTYVYADHEYMVTPGDNATPKQVAKFIRKFVKRRGND